MGEPRRKRGNREWRILMFDDRYFSSYGAQRSMVSLASGLSTSHNIDVLIVTVDEGRLAEHARSKGVPVHVLKASSRARSYGGEALRRNPFGKAQLVVAILKYGRDLEKLAARYGATHLYANSTKSMMYLLWAKIAGRRPSLLYVRGGHYYRPLNDIAVLSSSAVAVISPGARKALPSWAHSNAKVRVIPVGLPSRDRRRGALAASPTTKAADEAVTFGFVGSITHRKGHDVMAHSVRLLCERGLMNQFRVLVAGTPHVADRDYASEVTRQTQDLPVEWCGWIDDIESFLRRCDVFMLPSREEGLGRATLEAMRLGLPTLVTEAGGSEFTTEHGVSGLVIQPADAEGLANAMASLLKDHAGRRQMGVEARRRFQQEFAYTTYVDRFAALIASTATRDGNESLRSRPRGAA